MAVSPPPEAQNTASPARPAVPPIAGIIVGIAAVKWSHRPESAGAAEPLAPVDPDVAERLDDELRNLD